MFGKTDTIERHYQGSKQLSEAQKRYSSNAKGKRPAFIIVNGHSLKVNYLTPWYYYLWCVYFENNPELLEYASQYATFTDRFKTPSMKNCQADVIARIVNDGLDTVKAELSEFVSMINQPKATITVVNGDLLSYNGRIIAHQVNCKGKMGAGVALAIKNSFPTVYSEYKAHLKYKNYEKLGDMQPVEVVDGCYVCNLYGQLEYGRTNNQTNYSALKGAFKQLQDFAISKGINEVAMPFGIGCGLAGGNWDIVYSMIQETFTKVDVKLYKL